MIFLANVIVDSSLLTGFSASIFLSDATAIRFVRFSVIATSWLSCIFMIPCCGSFVNLKGCFRKIDGLL